MAKELDEDVVEPDKDWENTLEPVGTPVAVADTLLVIAPREVEVKGSPEDMLEL